MNQWITKAWARTWRFRLLLLLVGKEGLDYCSKRGFTGLYRISNLLLSHLCWLAFVKDRLPPYSYYNAKSSQIGKPREIYDSKCLAAPGLGDARVLGSYESAVSWTWTQHHDSPITTTNDSPWRSVYTSIKMVFSSPLTNLFIALQLTNTGYRKSMPSNHARERLLEDGLPLTAEVNEISECNSSVIQNTWTGVDGKRGRDGIWGGRRIQNASRNTGVQYPPIPDTMLLCSTVKAPIASSIFLSILQLPSWVQMLADYPEEAPSPHTLTSHLKALPSDSTHAWNREASMQGLSQR